MTKADVRTAQPLAERELRLLVDTIPTLVWKAGPDGNFEYVNARVLEYVGAPLAEVIGWGWIEKIHPDDFAFRARTWLKNLESEVPTMRSAEFEERTANTGGSMYAENHCELTMAPY